jgi:hypothetical protein
MFDVPVDDPSHLKVPDTHLRGSMVTEHGSEGAHAELAASGYVPFGYA